MIQVTKTYLPDMEAFKAYVEEIYKSGWFTNNGRFVKELQQKLSDYLGVKNLLLVSNGTLALQVAYKLLGLKGDVITTPFSFVATTSSLIWEGLNPVFVDIDEETFNLDPSAIEARITPSTNAIVATHVYGNACEVEAIETIARERNLKIIYDAAHAFSVNYRNESILNYGDISAISFHSTKIFHTIEGGAIVVKDDELYRRAQKMINFGIESPTEITELGINAKMNEFQAAMGLCMLAEFETNRDGRKKVSDAYMLGFRSMDKLRFQKHNPHTTVNYSHFPVLFENETTLLRVVDRLHEAGINPRRYFYPSLETLPYIAAQQSVPKSSDIAARILCLPLFDGLAEDVQSKIIDIIGDSL